MATNKRFKGFCFRLGWSVGRHRHPKITVKKLRKSTDQSTQISAAASAVIHPSDKPPHIRVATFNAALFSMAQAVPLQKTEFQEQKQPSSTDHHRPRGILKLRNSDPKSRLRVSINLPDNEISLQTTSSSSSSSRGQCSNSRSVTVFQVLKELNADILALQDVKAEEENSMKPLSDLARDLGMRYVFAESWAPQYGNAILSKWPIKTWKAHKLCDDSDFRNVVKATIDVPDYGEINILCTHLDHLDENLRMKQIDAIIQSCSDVPHILAGGLNVLDQTDYSQERWTHIVKYFEETRKPRPKVEVMKYLKSKHYTDAKEFAGECESAVMITKGQSVQGTCKYGTRVDYILSSAGIEYKFVPGSYSVVSSQGTSDHHIVKVDFIKLDCNKPHQCHKKRAVKITNSSSQCKGIWKLHSSK